jgi:aspartate/methionine/tyrosine aminotransferase
MSKRHLSARGQALVQTPLVAPYLVEHFAHLDDIWDANANPDGYIALCVAENRLMWDVLAARLGAVGEVAMRSLGYDSMIGNLEFRQVIARFMERTIVGRPIAAECIAVLAGAGTVIECMFYVLADAGDAVLIPTPSYAGFWPDLETRAGLRIVPVHTRSEDNFRLSIEALDEAFTRSSAPVKALLFTSPNNPLACISAREELLAIIDWAERNDVHVVFDEVYALSAFGSRPFVSAASLRDELGTRVHVIWAFSKDFGASGLRCGVLVSENLALIAAVDALAYWGACSGDTQYRLAAMLADQSFVDGYLSEMRRRLAEVYAEVVTKLDMLAIPHLPAEAGIFVLCDFRGWLDEPSWAGEDRLWRRFVDEAKVNLTPGSACRVAQPGWFRLCFATEVPHGVLSALDRLAKLRP